MTPLAIVIPTSEQYVWLRLSALRPANDLEIALLYPLVGTLVGAWTGAIPLPLDWNAPWQVRQLLSIVRTMKIDLFAI